MSVVSDNPRSPAVGIVSFVPDTWGGVWQLRHQILTRLSRYYPVLWVDPARDWRASFQQETRRERFARPQAESYPAFSLMPHDRWMPKVYRPAFIGERITAARVHRGMRYLEAQGVREFVGYLWRPEFADCLASGEFAVRCYHIDDEYSFSEEEAPVPAEERRIIESADQVFIHSPAMMEKKGSINPHTMFAPNGVDFAAFSAMRPMPADLASIPGPTVGYIGVLQSTIDWGLVREVAQSNANCQFVFVGPEGHLDPADRQHLDAIKTLPNAHFLGGKDVGLLPDYASHVDVCIMPYKRNDYTKYIFPLKVNEYLAAGKPTIGTPIRSLQDYSDVVGLAATATEWGDALQDCLSEASPRAERRECSSGQGARV